MGERSPTISPWSQNMPQWKNAFLNSLEPDLETEEDFEFGPPATDGELAQLEAGISAKIPEDVRHLLREFNGVKRLAYGEKEPYFFNTQEIPEAIEVYRDWDQPTDQLMQWSRNILYVCQENGFSVMWGVVIRPFGPFEYGQIVAFDHDRIRNAENPDELFVVPYSRLIDLVQADWKEST